jgi:hypothetical protein
MVLDADYRAVESIGMLPASQRTPDIVKSLLSPTFVADHPTLVRMLSTSDMDSTILKLFLDRIKLVRKGQEDVHDASVDVGGALARVYFPRT